MSTEEIKVLKQRERKAAMDKAWEKSSTRLLFIAGLIYIIATLLLFAMGETTALLKAFVPTIGYIFSIFSLPFIKRHWMDATYRKRA